LIPGGGIKKFIWAGKNPGIMYLTLLDLSDWTVVVEYILKDIKIAVTIPPLLKKVFINLSMFI